jgi:hypothetical protein
MVSFFDLHPYSPRHSMMSILKSASWLGVTVFQAN